jgi:hypothetical protein
MAVLLMADIKAVIIKRIVYGWEKILAASYVLFIAYPRTFCDR